METLSVASSQASSSSAGLQMSEEVEKRYQIVSSIAEVFIQEEELKNLLSEKASPICYDGFEPSVRMSIAEADICVLGMDQRKVNMLARKYCDDIERENKLTILSHHVLRGLQEDQEEISKSDPLSAIFMEDEEAEVNEKIEKAYCPPKMVQGNPCLDYIEYIILPWFDEFTVERNEAYGCNKTYKSFEEIAAEYESGELHPGDLKKGLTNALNKILQPVRDHFKTDAHAQNLLEQIKTA